MMTLKNKFVCFNKKGQNTLKIADFYNIIFGTVTNRYPSWALALVTVWSNTLDLFSVQIKILANFSKCCKKISTF